MVRVLASVLNDAQQLPAALLAFMLGVTLLVYFSTKRTTKTTNDKNTGYRQIHSLATRLPILGDLPSFVRNVGRLHEWMADVSLTFNGEPWRIHIPGLKDMVVITSPALVEEVLATQFANFPRGEQQIAVLSDLLGESLVASDGAKWFHQRKAASKFFTARALRVCMVTSIRKNVSQVYAVIDASTETHLDVGKLFQDFALQTFAEAGLGVDLQLIGNREPHPLDAIDSTSPIAMRRMQVPGFYWRLERWLNVGQERTVASAMASLRHWLDHVVQQSLEAATARKAASHAATTDKKHENEEKEETSTDDKVVEVKSVVELFLEQSAEDKHGLRAEDLVDFILTFVVAARSTSASALTWIFLTIAKHPLVEKRLRDEMTKELRGVAPGTYLTTEHISKLVYLEATIKEVLRLYPTIPVMHKEAAEDTVLGGDMVIKKGEIIAVPQFVQARMPSVWGPDAAELNPNGGSMSQRVSCSRPAAPSLRHLARVRGSVSA